MTENIIIIIIIITEPDEFKDLSGIIQNNKFPYLTTFCSDLAQLLD